MSDRSTASREDLQETPLVELVAQAKLTLMLRVIGVRADGYHLLESEMVTLDLADSLFVGDGDGLSVATEFVRGNLGAQSAGAPAGSLEPPVAGGGAAQSEAAQAASIPTGTDNLVARALVAVGRTASVHLVKRVPPGAGLGGGSADAAAIFRWAGCTDLGLAAALGADIPFCVTGGRAMVRGIGEALEPLPYEERQFTLLLLPFGVDTGAVYRAWDGLAERGELPPPGSTSNDLEAPALLVEPRLARWKAEFADRTGRQPHLAGSGSTWFVDGIPEDSGVGGRRWLQRGDERAQLVSVSTTPARHEGR